ncbi:uncharacterized protein LOC131680889 [Topomyia yanbarensis]|uniref:uncharacterized protein LOC131680889 n=1 Tax=Topomyia yanbarensis TaxID=2498891 RepID=UPI00273AE3E6|nr:uncharacterized protein LOC131680889 [Topomyia yanbarensis]
MNFLPAIRGRSLAWWFPVRNNLESLSQLQVVLKLFGVMIYTVVDRVSCRIEITLGDWLLLAIFTTLRVYGTVDGLVNDRWQPLVESDLQAVMYGMGFTIFFMIVLLTVLPFYLMLLHRRFEVLLQLLNEFDEEFNRLGYPRDHRYHHFRTTGYVLLCLTALAIIFAITFMLRDRNFLWEALLFLSTFNATCFAYTLQHAGLNMMIFATHSRMELMNRYIREMLGPEGGNGRQKEDLVMQLARLYDKLCDVTEIINVVLCAPLFFNFINTFFLHVTSCYACMRILLNRATPSETSNSLLYLSWSGYFNIFVFQTVTFATRLRQQTSTFVGAVHRHLNQPHNRRIITRLQQLSEQIDNRAPSVTFFLFELHPSLIIQAGGELATYMLILIQFEMQ